MSCTTILVGKNASYDGSTIIARDDDSGSGRYDPKRFVAVAPRRPAAPLPQRAEPCRNRTTGQSLPVRHRTERAE
ncbi:C69 family dipeptidase [Bifidobacterium longum]|uniref:C69 family dipeptidase n=1 Tax=Bifidobacterium longum TaxID=216816 RepID=UPI00373FCA1C